MKRYLLLFSVLMLFFTTVNAQEIEILETGQFHEEEVTAKNGEMWMGLYKKGDSYVILPSVLSVKSVSDPVVDTENQISGKEVKVPGQGKPVFLIKGKVFTQGLVIKTFFGGVKPIDTNFDESYKFNDKKYRLKIISENKENVAKQFLSNNTRLVLSVGENEQVLYSVEECSFCRWHINWIGDLDADGKLDFYIQLTDHYNVMNQKLFLSSQAENGKLVKEVAEFRTTGC